MKNMLCREMLWPDEIGNMLSVRNAIFPPISEEDWLRYPSNTAAMAFLEGIPIGAIPLDQRRFQVAPGKIINTAFEHAVGTRADFRSRGVGNAMIDAARQFLADRAEALMVYRGGERSAGYRFYEKTGHVDLVYMRPLTWKLGDAGEAKVAVGGIDDVIAAEADLLRVFDAAFGTYGGFVPREVGYWERALSEMIFTVIPSDILFIRYPAEGALEAYCIASVRTAARSDDSVRIMEIAGESDESVREALRGICAEGVSRNLPVSTIACVDSPWRMLMREMGFEEGLRHTMIMGQTIAPARQFERVCADIDALAGLKVDIWAPGFEHTIYQAPDATRQITIEGKELLLQRMLMRRLDIRAAVASDLLTIANEERGDQDRLAAALPYCPWEYHWLDWT